MRYHSHQKVCLRAIANEAIEELNGRIVWVKEEIDFVKARPEDYDVGIEVDALEEALEKVDAAIAALNELK